MANIHENGKEERKILAIHCAASLFELFYDEDARGIAWDVELMPSLITESIRTQANLYKIKEYQALEMVRVGLEFYRKYLRDAIRHKVYTDDEKKQP